MQPRTDSNLQCDGEPDRWVHSACLLCSNGCGTDIAVKDGAIVGVRGNVAHGDVGDRPDGQFRRRRPDRLVRRHRPAQDRAPGVPLSHAQPHFKSSPVALPRLSFGEPEPWLLARMAELNGDDTTPFATRSLT